MNAIKDIWRQLVRRRLWPLAVLLIVAAAAVPMLLSKAPETIPASAVAKLEADDNATTFVSVAPEGETESTATRRRVLGAPKDPFEPQALPKAKKKKQPAKAETSAGKDAPQTETSDSATPDAPTASAPVIPTPTATPKPTYPLNSIKVRFGKVEETATDLTAKTVERLSVLPDDEHPVLVYTGVEDGGKVAIFELTGTIVAEGDGACEPTPEDCQLLKLRAGETEFITVAETGEETDGQYQLDVVKIHSKAAGASSGK